MSIAVRDILSVEDFLKLPELKPALEFIKGRIVQKVAPTLPHSVLTLKLMNRINQFTEPRRLGLALPELRCSFGGESFVPDVCFFARGRLPKDAQGRYAERVLQAPDFVVEIVSPGQTVGALGKRLTRCVEKGVRLGWLIQPSVRRVFVCRRGHERHTLEAGAVLSGEDVLPNFTLPLDELFDWLQSED